MAQLNSVPDNNGSNVRYGRAFIYGFGSTPSIDTCAAGPRQNPNPYGCKNDGYVTNFAWGYRLRGQLEYASVMGSAFSLYPSLYLAHDVNGVSIDSQLNGGRMTIGTGLRVDYLKAHRVEVNYVNYVNTAHYDPLHDRDFYSISYSYTF